MLYHSFSRLFAEKRLLAFAGGADTPKPAPEIQITNELKEKSPLDPEAKIHLAIEAAGKDAAAMKKDCRDGWQKAAQAHYEAVTKAGGAAKKSPESAVRQLNEIFEKAGVTFTVNAGKLVMHDKPAAAPDKPVAGKDKSAVAPEKKPLTAEQQKEIDKILDGFDDPKLRTLVKPILNDVLSGGKTLDAAKTFKEEYAKAISSGKSLGTRQEVVAFVDRLPTREAQEFGKRIIAAVDQSMGAGEGDRQEKPATAEKLSEADKKAISIAAAKAYGKFDESKATPNEKNMIIARLMMMGIDTADSTGIFEYKPGPDGSVDETAAEKCFKPMEGTKFERAMNQVMGLIGYIVAFIDKFNSKSENNKKQNVPATAPATGPDGGNKKEGGAAVPGEKPTDAALKEKVKSKGFSNMKNEADAAVAAEKNKLDGVPGTKGLNVQKIDAEAKVGKDKLELDKEKKALDDLKIKTPPATPAEMRAQEDKVSAAEKKVGDRDKVVKDLDKDIATATKRHEDAKATQTSLEQLKTQSEEMRRQVGEQITAVKTALTPPASIANLPSAKAIAAALTGVTLGGLDGKLEFSANFVPVKMEAAAKAVDGLKGEASAWQLDGTKLKNPEAFLKSLKEVVGKVQDQQKTTDAQKEEQKNNAISPEEAANVTLLQSANGLKIVKDGTWKPDEKDGKNPTIAKVCDAIKPTNRAALDSKIITGLSSYLNEQLQDITKDSGKVALSSLLAQRPGNWTNAADQYSNLAAALKGDGFPQGVTYDEAGNVQLFKPDAAMKAKIQPKLPVGFNAALKAEMSL